MVNQSVLCANMHESLLNGCFRMDGNANRRPAAKWGQDMDGRCILEGFDPPLDAKESVEMPLQRALTFVYSKISRRSVLMIDSVLVVPFAFSSTFLLFVACPPAHSVLACSRACTAA